MGKIIVIGSSNTDMVVRSPRIPTDGETILGGDFKIIQGGKGANQAVAVARAGGNVWFVAKVGNDSFGLEAKNRYKLDGIHADYVSVVEKTPTGVAFIVVSEATGQNAIVFHRGKQSTYS
jgi:ribokinase